MLAASREGGEPMVFGFGKRASNSPPASSNGGGDDTYRQQPPHIRRLIDAMQTIFDDTSKLAQAIRQGSSLPSSTPAEPNFSPIRCSASETLFEHANDNGEKLYSTLSFYGRLQDDKRGGAVLPSRDVRQNLCGEPPCRQAMPRIIE
jgi:hypothetical protein